MSQFISPFKLLIGAIVFVGFIEFIECVGLMGFLEFMEFVVFVGHRAFPGSLSPDFSK